MQSTATAASVRQLLARAVDYAGLFPPAGLSMKQSVLNYAAYAAGPNRWLLGRLIVPAARLEEFHDAVRSLEQHDHQRPWELSVIIGDDTERDLEILRTHNESSDASACVQACELKATSVETLAQWARAVPVDVMAYFEVPLQSHGDEFAAAAAELNVGIKARTGGVTADAFPGAAAVARFIESAVGRRVPYKLTAGLHHPLAGEYRLTYEPGSPVGAMFGFLNVFVAACLATAGASSGEVAGVLGERDARVFDFSGAKARWRSIEFSADQITATRELLAGFGSCSFEEPVEELTALGFIA